MSDKVVVTVSRCVQIGADEFQQNRTSNVFDASQSINEMLEWARAVGIRNPRINDLQFSEYIPPSAGVNTGE